ncbi:MAG: hypothetical protein LC793_17635 [Thermomicrobia bacterium]|nr:hypothetical protein [Thermomicrobia bacterium]MCA1724846.1 hypothetical protein [Thermomicrobia bacterium]
MMEVIGRIVRLQVQESSLKVGDRLRRWYDPAPIRAVPMLTLDANGVVGQSDSGETILDVHNATHPATKNRAGSNGISIGFTAHYGAMRARFGDHLPDGIAGENILVATERVFTEAEFAAGIRIETSDGATIDLQQVIIAEPCVEFSRFALRYPLAAPSDRAVTDALNFLREGTRGFYAAYRGIAMQVAVSARVYLL